METAKLDWTDTHCHLYAPEFDEDRAPMIKRAIDAGVTRMMLPNIDFESIGPMLHLVEQYPEHCFPMMGLHPCSVKPDFREILDVMKSKLADGQYAGIGETGIDLYWDTTFQKEQVLAFELQIGWAKAYDLPVIIHSRESLDLNIEIIAGLQHGSLRGIFHCFGGNTEQALKIAALGFKIGIGGVITFKKSDLGEVIGKVPPEILVLETDAPYLAPVPYRGKRNESSYLPLVAQNMAESLGMTLGDVARLTRDNANEVFGKKH